MFPKYREVQEPLLNELIRRGGSARPSDRDSLGRTIYDALADAFSLSDEDRSELIYERNGTPRSKWENIVRWVRNDLKKKGIIDGSQQGIWTVSPQGRSFSDERESERVGRGVISGSRKITPKRFEQLQQRAREIGEAGETIVLEQEREFLRANGRNDLARAIVHVSKRDVAAGYDVLSFTLEGESKYIEVKTTTTSSETFEITINEWNTAKRHGDSYWIYHVRELNRRGQTIHKIRNPVQLEQQGAFILNAVAFRVVPSERHQ